MTDYKQLCVELLDAIDHFPGWIPPGKRPVIGRARAALAEPEPDGLPVWTEAIYGDGAVFLKDGVMVPIEEVVRELNRGAQARADLAKPELEGPSFSDVMEWVLAVEPWATWLAPGGCLESAHFEFYRLVTAAVARWGSSQGILDSSTLQPVPVSETRPEFSDCDDAGRVWCFNWALNHWKLSRIKQEVHSHWLPAHALSLPTSGEGKA